MKTYTKKSPNRKTLLGIIAECNRQDETAYQRYRIEHSNLGVLREAALAMLALKESRRKK